MKTPTPTLFFVEVRLGRFTVGWIRHYGGERPHAEIVATPLTATPHIIHPSTHPAWAWLVEWARGRGVEAVVVEMRRVEDGDQGFSGYSGQREVSDG